MNAVETLKITGQASIEQTCNCFGMHRDAYYKYKKRYQKWKTIESNVVQMVNDERKEQPRVL